jgi:hypothetical protein
MVLAFCFHLVDSSQLSKQRHIYESKTDAVCCYHSMLADRARKLLAEPWYARQAILTTGLTDCRLEIMSPNPLVFDKCILETAQRTVLP